MCLLSAQLAASAALSGRVPRMTWRSMQWRRQLQRPTAAAESASAGPAGIHSPSERGLDMYTPRSHHSLVLLVEMMRQVLGV